MTRAPTPLMIGSLAPLLVAATLGVDDDGIKKPAPDPNPGTNRRERRAWAREQARKAKREART
jgi:hypothetical protein